MKRIFHTLFLVFVYLNSVAQEGIVFEQGTWQEVLEKAKASNRPVFIDMYTTWCGPCKKMAKDIFPLKEVGDKFNASFINYKVDAEKGEGLEIAATYHVNSFPTYLFVTGEGVLVYRSLGSMPAEKFLAEAALALTEYSDPSPLAQWMDAYEEKKTDSVFLRQYIDKRKKLRLNCADVLDQYFSVIGKDAMFDSPLLPGLGTFMNLNSDGPFFRFLSDNRDTLRKLILNKYNKGVLLNEYLVMMAKTDVDRAVAAEDESLLNLIVRVLLELPADQWPVSWREGEVKLKYYTQTRQPEALKKVIQSYSAQLTSFERARVAALDSAAAAKFDSDLSAGKLGKMSPENAAMTRKFRALQHATQLAYKIRDAAKSVAIVLTDKNWLKKALGWVEHAASYSDNFTIEETRALVLYQSGRKEEAIRAQQNGISQFTAQMQAMNITNDKIRQRLEDALQKMKEGLPLTGLK